MEWFIKCWKQYADFRGRARRKEYWYFVLFNALISAVLGGIDYAIISMTDGSVSFTFLSTIYSLAVLIPGLAVVVRRLHDVGRSGWWYLIGLIPLVGAIILLVWFFTEGQHFENAWGPDPKAPVQGSNYEV